MSIDVRNFAIVTHAVPADRVRAHLPDPYELQTFSDDGDELSLVSATCFCNKDFRWSALPYPRHTFNENTYRTYVTHKGRVGVYFFRRYLGTQLARLPQRVFERFARHGDFEVDVDIDEEGVHDYFCSVEGDGRRTEFELSALDVPDVQAPFETPDEHAQFITYRLHGFFTSSAGFQGHMPVSHPRMDPWAGRLLNGRFDVWHELGILKPDEAGDVYSVLVQPQIDFTLYPPRPLV